jgi:hypothetical protein
MGGIRRATGLEKPKEQEEQGNGKKRISYVELERF